MKWFSNQKPRQGSQRQKTEPDQEGYAVQSRGDWGDTIGWLKIFDERLVEALHVVLCLLVAPES